MSPSSDAQHGEAVAVGHVANDKRFYRGVDEVTLATTRTLLAAPMRTEGPSIGVEVMNPAPGRSGREDVEFLDVVASDIVVAYAKAELHDRLRAAAGTLRRLARVAGMVLTVAGVLDVTAAPRESAHSRGRFAGHPLSGENSIRKPGQNASFIGRHASCLRGHFALEARRESPGVARDRAGIVGTRPRSRAGSGRSRGGCSNRPGMRQPR
jgi:hypothetical protein